MKIAESAMTAVAKQISDTQRRIDDLTLVAPIDGVLVAPKLTEMSGAFLPRGQEVATVAAMDTLVIKAALTQEDAELIHDHTNVLLDANADQGTKDRIQVQFAGDIHMRDAVPASAAVIINASQDVVPHPSLLQGGGGEIAPDPTDPKGEHPLAKIFEVHVRVPNPNGKYYPGQRAYVRFRVDKKPLIWQWTNRFLQLLQSHENDSKLT
jgi:hypothetical protein